MSFLSSLNKINQGVQLGTGLATTLYPFVSLIPGFGPEGLGTKALASIILAETIFTEAHSGTVRGDQVEALLTVAFPHLDKAKMRKVVDTFVAALNALADAAPEPVISFPVTVKT